ncbi:cysteine desulfurase-like protein [Taklimakanibacter albus]|uniref:Cysteine desulfurase-like protein n=1 Tax=Taklimakanibacter albus TaxID=2800327 RepID=A0ACC5R9M4_9HYPH|nr:cysteine desulfurase-like protein [Aestuariivirga sp. YIM B02566]MBK1869317.1 cysteine desulfurase-like protein [Aestuariivirga sp. YIM B02566]
MATAAFSLDSLRAQFPSLSLKDDGKPRVYFDNPAGTQVPQRVIERTLEALVNKNANLGGYFTTTVAAETLVNEAHQAMADFYHAGSAREIVFGQNMTTLTMHMSRCLGKRFSPGDEIVLSRMDHDANVSPWLLLAEDRGLTVRWMEFDPETYEFPEDALTKVLSPKTKLVAMGFASNCTGTINDVKHFAKQTHEAGALFYVDAVQLAPHVGIDVRDLGCDFLVSSAYKFFGPHQGILWGREALLEETFSYKVRPAGNDLPHKFETGTLSHEGMAGTLGAVEYLASFGGKPGASGKTYAHMSERGAAIHRAFDVFTDWEHHICNRLIAGLQSVKGLRIRGITSPNAVHRRVPTVSFTLEGHTPQALAKAFAERNIFVWSGHNYAVEPVTVMGLMDKGGVLRVGLAHYNTEAEVDGFLAALHQIKG